MILFFWKKSNSLRTCGNLKENDNFFLCNNESKISFIFIYKIILKQYQSMSNWFLKLLWIERRGQAQFATTTKLFSLWKWERLMHNIQKSFPFPVARAAAFGVSNIHVVRSRTMRDHESSGGRLNFFYEPNAAE